MCNTELQAHASYPHLHADDVFVWEQTPVKNVSFFTRSLLQLRVFQTSVRCLSGLKLLH